MGSTKLEEVASCSRYARHREGSVGKFLCQTAIMHTYSSSRFSVPKRSFIYHRVYLLLKNRRHICQCQLQPNIILSHIISSHIISHLNSTRHQSSKLKAHNHVLSLRKIFHSISILLKSSTYHIAKLQHRFPSDF